MNKTLGVSCALVLLIVFATGCSSRQVIPITSNCSKMKGEPSTCSPCKIVNQKGTQYFVHESNNFSFKAPTRWSKHFTYSESDQSEKGCTNYTLTVQLAASTSEESPHSLPNLMILKVMDRKQWDLANTDTEQLLAKTDNLVYTVQLPDHPPADLSRKRGAQFKKMKLDLEEAKSNFKLLP